MSNFIQPVYRLSKAPVSDETPFADVSPAVSASQACRQLSQPYRLFANALLLRLLGRNLSLVASDSQLRGFRAGSLSRDLEDAKQSSSVLRGESRPPSSQPGVSSPSKRFAAATPVQPGPLHQEGDPASAGPSRRWSYDSPSGSFGHSSRQGSDTPPRKRRRLSDDSLLLVLLCLGDNHTPSHLTSLPQIRPDAHFARRDESPPPPPPIKRLGYQLTFV